METTVKKKATAKQKATVKQKTAVKKIEITIPEVDMDLLKELANKFGWNIRHKKSGIEKGLEDIKAGRVYKAKNAEDMFKQILG